MLPSLHKDDSSVRSVLHVTTDTDAVLEVFFVDQMMTLQLVAQLMNTKQLEQGCISSIDSIINGGRACPKQCDPLQLRRARRRHEVLPEAGRALGAAALRSLHARARQLQRRSNQAGHPSRCCPRQRRPQHVPCITNSCTVGTACMGPVPNYRRTATRHGQRLGIDIVIGAPSQPKWVVLCTTDTMIRHAQMYMRLHAAVLAIMWAGEPNSTEARMQ